ncbi:MAG TPA: hypothetical protein VMF55_10125 [Solirubrobacterales bacterium]|nr:hypothetical protein [Solirubrobacterales bacterium]
MREKLNDNPVAQIALIAVLVLVGGYLLLSSMGGGSSEAATESAEVESAEPAAATSAVAAPVDKRLPHAVEAAYDRGETIALLIYRRGGIDDQAVGAASAVIQTMPGVAFFDAPTGKIARYSAITGPVGVNRAPALIVVRARKKGDLEPAPATVTYGFQGPEEVRQAVIDAGYAGPEPSYAPN